MDIPSSTVKSLREWLAPKTSRALRPALCRDCRAVIARGLNDDLAAQEVTVDPIPLSTLGRVTAMVRGCTLHTLTRTETGWIKLTPRNRWERKPSWVKQDIWPSHQCGTTWEPAHITDTQLTPWTGQEEIA